MANDDSIKNRLRQNELLEEVRKSLPYNHPDKDYIDYLNEAILKEPKHYGHIDSNLKVRITANLL